MTPGTGDRTADASGPRSVALPWRLAWPVAVASELAGLIHLAFAREHLHEWIPFGLFFLASGFFQIVWAAMAFAPRSRRFFVFGLVVNALTAVLWAITRTVGLPVGPEHWSAEVAGPPDITATALEALIVAIGVWVLATAARSPRVRHAPA
ncbi:MAG TPA: hypothetical protein VFB35_05865 [Gaiellaceae bacterium]|nr:hypothetical protein [Gaiellaceae bacterium]